MLPKNTSLFFRTLSFSGSTNFLRSVGCRLNFWELEAVNFSWFDGYFFRFHFRLFWPLPIFRKKFHFLIGCCLNSFKLKLVWYLFIKLIIKDVYCHWFLFALIVGPKRKKFLLDKSILKNILHKKKDYQIIGYWNIKNLFGPGTVVCAVILATWMLDIGGLWW